MAHKLTQSMHVHVHCVCVLSLADVLSGHGWVGLSSFEGGRPKVEQEAFFVYSVSKHQRKRRFWEE